jgi:hypothetical protein
MRIVTTSAASLRLGGRAEASDAALVPKIVGPNRVEALVFSKRKGHTVMCPFFATSLLLINAGHNLYSAVREILCQLLSQLFFPAGLR